MKLMLQTLNPEVGFNYLKSQIAGQKYWKEQDVDREVLQLRPRDIAEIPMLGIFLENDDNPKNLEITLIGFVRYSTETQHLYSLYIHPTWRGNQYATKILKHLSPKTLHVMPNNHRAIALYRRLGFEITKTIAGGLRYEMQRKGDTLCVQNTSLG